MGEPRLIVADGPTGNLGTATGTEIVELRFSLRDSHGITIVIGTHDETLATRCDTFIHLREGHNEI